MAGDLQHTGQRMCPGQVCDVVIDGVVKPEAADIPAFGLTLQQVQIARLEAGDSYAIEGTQWSPTDELDLGLSEAERWIEIQMINTALIGGPGGQVSWTDHYSHVRFRKIGSGTTACIKYVGIEA